MKADALADARGEKRKTTRYHAANSAMCTHGGQQGRGPGHQGYFLIIEFLQISFRHAF